MKFQPLPELRPITKISPTLLATLKQCQLRAGLSQARAQRTTRSSTAALLGTIVHRVLEKAREINSESRDLRSQAETMWNKTVDEMEKELQVSSFDRYLLPITKWKRYFLSRERTIRKCEEIALSRGVSETQVIASERKFDSVKDGLVGKPDLILRKSNDLVIIDYKSAEFPDDVQKREKLIDSWRQQILFYASIVKADFGEWAARGEIRLLSKEVIHVPIDPREVKGITQEAQALKENYNAQIAAGVLHSELARYSVEGCGFCEFKGACDKFWEQNLQLTLEANEYKCLNGRVLRLTTNRNDKYSMVIASENSESPPQEWHISSLSAEQFGNLGELRQGTFVRLIDFKIEPGDSYRAKPTQNSVI